MLNQSKAILKAKVYLFSWVSFISTLWVRPDGNIIIVPFLFMTKPEPKDDAFLSVGLWNSLNISSNGEPGGNWKGNWFDDVLTVWVVEIFTTDGINFSARSANDAGASFANTCDAKLIANNKMNNLLILFILIFNIPNNYKAYNCEN